jgi:uncharacterized protein YjbK
MNDYKKAKAKKMSYLYFDTGLQASEAIFFLLNIRLRLRIKNGNDYSLELKIHPPNNSSEDFYQKLSFLDIDLLFQGLIPNGVIKNKLVKLNVLRPVIWIKTTHVARIKRFFYGGILVLERTSCLNQTSYQIEFRSERPISVYNIRTIKKQLGLCGRLYFCSKLKQVWTK